MCQVMMITVQKIILNSLKIYTSRFRVIRNIHTVVVLFSDTIYLHMIRVLNEIPIFLLFMDKQVIYSPKNAMARVDVRI